jgi:hypothetical protein
VIHGILGEIRFVARPRQPRERGPISPLLAPLVAHDVGGDAIEPWQLALGSDFSLVSTSPRFEKHDGSQILSQLAISRASVAVAINPLRVLVPKPHIAGGVRRGSGRSAASARHHPLYVRTVYSVRGPFEGGILPRGGHTGIVGLPRGGHTGIVGLPRSEVIPEHWRKRESSRQRRAGIPVPALTE